MFYAKTILVGGASLFSLVSPLRAGTVTAAATIEAIDTTARTITVRRKTTNGEKTAMLKVGQNAQIHRDGKSVAISTMAKGDVGELVYDTTLKEITTINIQSKATPPDESSRDAGCTFFILRISETGDCVAELTREPPPAAKGEGLQIASLPGAEIVKTKEGLYRVRHDFATCDLSAFRETRSVSARSDKLIFGLPAKDGAMIAYPKTWRLPLEVNLAVADFGANTLIVSASSGNDGLLLNWSSDWGSGGGLRSRCFLDVGWREGDGAARRTRPLVEHIAVNTKSFKRTFRLPYPNEPTADRFFVSIGVKGNSPLTAKSLTISGRLLPMFGIALEARGDTVFASQVVAKSLAEAAGVREGNVLVSINGEAPRSVKDAMSLLGKVAIDDVATLVVRRAGAEKTIQVNAE